MDLLSGGRVQWMSDHLVESTMKTDLKERRDVL